MTMNVLMQEVPADQIAALVACMTPENLEDVTTGGLTGYATWYCETLDALHSVRFDWSDGRVYTVKSRLLDGDVAYTDEEMKQFETNILAMLPELRSRVAA